MQMGDSIQDKGIIPITEIKLTDLSVVK